MFVMFWILLVFLLVGVLYYYSDVMIGLFGLVGVVGMLVVGVVGWMVDCGKVVLVMMLVLVLLVVLWLLLGFLM